MNNYNYLTLTLGNQARLAKKLTDFLKKGICSIEFDFGDRDPFTIEKYQHVEYYQEGRAIKINKPSIYRNDETLLLRTPIASPEDGRHFQKGSVFFFPKSDTGIIYMKYTAQNSKPGFLDAENCEVMKITLLATKPYKKTDRSFIEKCKNERKNAEALDWFEIMHA